MLLPFSQKKGRPSYGLKHELLRNVGIVVTGFVKVQNITFLITRVFVHDNVLMERTLSHSYYWGEPERAPHICDVCKFCLSVCLSVCLSGSLSVGSYVHDTIIYKCYSNLRIPSIIDCSFEQLVEQYVSQTVL